MFNKAKIVNFFETESLETLLLKNCTINFGNCKTMDNFVG